MRHGKWQYCLITPTGGPDQVTVQEDMMANDSKPKGWHSRRYETDAAHKLANEHYDRTHTRHTAAGNEQGHQLKLDKEGLLRQRQKLDERLGQGQGATKERKRLQVALEKLG